MFGPRLIFRYINTRLWSKAGDFNKALSKGPKTTTWIWNLHDHAHELDSNNTLYNLSQPAHTPVITGPALRAYARKVFSSNLAHLSLVFFWISGMHFHGAYFSNYALWLKGPSLAYPSSHSIWCLIGQDILNDINGQYFSGMGITSGIFTLWRSEGIITHIHFKYACTTSVIPGIICISPALYHMRMMFAASRISTNPYQRLAIHHLMIIFGSSCISWSSHLIHISLPANPLLDSGSGNPLFLELNKPTLISNADLIQIILPGFRIGPLVNFAVYLHMLSNNPTSILGSTLSLLNSSPSSVFLAHITAHHFTLGYTLIIVGLIGYLYVNYTILDLLQDFHTQWHVQLSLNLALHRGLSYCTALYLSAIPMYPIYSSSKYPTLLCLLSHHIWVGGFLIIGAGAHGSMVFGPTIGVRHRDLQIGHLIWVSIALGLHTFSLYCHNDTLEALLRPEDIFHDNSIQLKPVFAQLFCWKMQSDEGQQQMDELGTADFTITHLHAFTIHVTFLILSKGLVYARNSRFVSDKLELGFRYPCDGPGRGGTCQISPSDHLSLSVFWMYNCLDILLFHYFWKMQSDVWGIYNTHRARLTQGALKDPNPTTSFCHQIPHISPADFNTHGTTINGWLRNFLWSQAAQVIQSYGTSISGYGFIFISAHFIWAFSLMFLYSGRGYWQELIESILWGHHKLKIMVDIQPRALDISQGRAVGFIHYTLGGVGCTWAFFISRTIVLT